MKRCVLAAVSVVLTAHVGAEDIREKVTFKGPFDMRTASGVTMTFVCDDYLLVKRTYVYFKSGAGYYAVPFRVTCSGTNTVFVDRSDCLREEEGKVEGWANVSEAFVSFYHEEGTPLKWSVSDFAVSRRPYDTVISVADRSAHRFAKKLKACGLKPLVTASYEVDDVMLAPARLLVPVAGKKTPPASAIDAIARFKARGGAEMPIGARLKATSHEKLLRLLMRLLPEKKEVFGQKLAEERERKLRNAKAAEALPAFLLAGGDDEIRSVSCHTAYGPELVEGDPKWENWDRNCRLLKAAGFNTVNVNVARGGIAFYRSRFLPESPEVETKGDSVELIKKACEKHGMKFIAWKVCFNSRIGMKTPTFEKWIADGRGAVSYKGEKNTRWLCPVNPENRALEVEAVVELAKKRPWAVTIDYIRYHGKEWCFCGTCREAFEKYAGTKIEKWPTDVPKDPVLDRKWEEFRRHTITSLVREISRRMRAEAPGVKLRADLFASPEGDAVPVAQEWDVWCREGLLDIAGPMDGSSPERIRHLLARQLPKAKGAKGFIPTYYPSLASADYNASTLMEVVRVGREAGLAGFSLFRFDGRLIEMLALEKNENR